MIKNDFLLSPSFWVKRGTLLYNVNKRKIVMVYTPKSFLQDKHKISRFKFNLCLSSIESGLSNQEFFRQHYYLTNTHHLASQTPY